MDNKIKPPFCEAASFNELEENAKKIIDRVEKEVKQKTESGMRNPVLFFSDCSDVEKATIQQCQNHRTKDAILAEKMKTTPTPITEIGKSPSPFFMPCVQSISRLFGRSVAEEENKDTPYRLMHLFLNRVCLRWYDGKFYCFENGVYCPVPDLKMLVLGVLEPELSQGKTNQRLRSVVELLESYPYIRVQAAQLPPEEIPFRNGILDLSSGILRPVLPKDFFISHITIPYPQGVTQCPIFDRFLRMVANNNQNVIDAIWEMIGYLLTTDMAGKVFFVLQGVGDSGKSVLGSLIASFFNEEAVSHLDISRLGDRFSPSILQGKLLNVCMDLPDGHIRKEAVGTIKQVTGGDTIAVEGKFKNAKSLCPTCKFLFGTNFPLRIERDQAFEARCIIIPFMAAIPKDAQDKHLLKKLITERPAIAVRALAAYQRLKARNYKFIDLGVSGTFTGWIPLIQQLESFLKHCCVFEPGLHTPTEILFSAFNDYCTAHQSSGIDDRIQFSRQLNQLCRGRITPRKKRGPYGNLNGYDGIGIRSPHELEGLQ